MFGSTMCLFIGFLSHIDGQALSISLCAILMTCQQFQHSPNLFGDCEAYHVWPTKRCYPMWPWPLSVLLHIFIRLVFISDGIRVGVVVGVIRVLMT